MVTLKDYYEKKDYAVGLAILAKHSKNRILLQNLTRRQNIPKLDYELRRIAEAQGYKPDAETIITPVQAPSHSDQQIDELNKKSLEISEQLASGKLVVTVEGRQIKFESLPKELQARWKQNVDNYKMMRSLHEKLKLMHNATPEDREPLISKMVAMDSTNRKNWDMIDAYDPSVMPPTNEVGHKRINANRTFIVRNLKKLSALTDKVKAADLSAAIRVRYNEVISAGESFSPDTIEELKKAGIEC